MNKLLMTEPMLMDWVARLVDNSDPLSAPSLAVWSNRMGDDTEYLVGTRNARAKPAGRLVVWRWEGEPGNPPFRLGTDRLAVLLGIGFGRVAGQVIARVVHADGREEAVDDFRIIGQGMPVVFTNKPEPLELAAELLNARGLYSRIIGPVGLHAFRRLQTGIGVVGAGGTGGLMIENLARLMPEAEMTVIDRDTFESGNIMHWAAPRGELQMLGEHKVSFIHDHLRDLPNGPRRVLPLPYSVLDARSAAALKRCEILLCCVDNAPARFATAFLAALYMKPMIDVATAVFAGDSAEQHLALATQENQGRSVNILLWNQLPLSLLDGPKTRQADVRLFVPGRGCLACVGGAGDREAIMRGIEESGHESRAEPFWLRRLGSSPALNHAAVARAIDLLLAWVSPPGAAMPIVTSQHWQADVRAIGEPVNWRLVSSPPRMNCPLCAVTGLGDSGLELLGETADQI